ncbi:conserved hypothetical protein [Candidatus Terasakiella magnetica]|uniref:DUF58 domain-containing protein n=1 Tax=Candidatus Terasakiella magnetica TaxID=1867952 RepID=A0A1C3RLV2_9PROT|nr:DUF58 domain-containing protein [Candidatus Terasakiella magnetica]SCA58216.1 conserved hypothetical protein [Candidatus Terasakiella magnetica]
MANTPVIHQAEEAASSLPPLLVEAERVANTVAQGVHGRRKKGQGDSFWQFRPYQVGEPTRAIDWRQSAKTEHHFVREYEWEAAQTVWLWCDPSASMKYSGDAARPDKLRRAEILTLALASLLVRGGEQIALLGYDAPPGRGRAALHRLANVMEKKKTHQSESVEKLQSLPSHAHLPRHAELVLIGDFLSPMDEIEEALKLYSRRHVRGHLLQVLDPAEESLPFEGRVNFKGLEEEGSIYFGNVAAVREEYRERLSARRAALSELTHSLGWGFHRHTTNQPAETALLALFLSITQGVK